MLVKLGQYTLIDPNSIRKGTGAKPGKGGGGGKPQFSDDDPQKMDDIPLVGQEKPGIRTQRSVTSKTASVKTKAKEYKKRGKSKIYRGNKAKPDWKTLAAKAAGKSNSDKFKDMVQKLASSEPLVDWQNELKRFFNATFNKKKTVLPNRRFVAGGKYLYGRKQAGKDTLRTIVAAIDTSSSISQKQSNTFVKEVMYLCKKYDANMTYIIYCSDDIDGVDKVKKGGTPDLSKWASTGGNAKGFIPPFAYVEKENINPSIFIYLTDTGGEMPDPRRYGIEK